MLQNSRLEEANPSDNPKNLFFNINSIINFNQKSFRKNHFLLINTILNKCHFDIREIAANSNTKFQFYYGRYLGKDL